MNGPRDIELDEYGLPKLHHGKELGEPIITLTHVQKVYQLEGREESVRALEDIHVALDSEFYPVRRY
jgi:putative ABC transport system ATP-binding protein